MRLAVAAVSTLAACDARVDFVVDATQVAEGRPDGTLVVDLVRQGSLLERRSLVLADSVDFTLRDAIEVPFTHGIAAWMDLDGNERCTGDEDLAWAFEYLPGYNEPLEWVVSPTRYVTAEACSWFDDQGSVIPDPPSDTGDDS